jgi:hypothetical protein
MGCGFVGRFGEAFPQGLKASFILERLRHATHPLGGCAGRALIQGRRFGTVLSHPVSCCSCGEPRSAEVELSGTAGERAVTRATTRQDDGV